MQGDPHRDLQGSPVLGHQEALHKTLLSSVKRKGGRERERVYKYLLNYVWFPYDSGMFPYTSEHEYKAFKLPTWSSQYKSTITEASNGDIHVNCTWMEYGIVKNTTKRTPTQTLTLILKNTNSTRTYTHLHVEHL